MTLEEAIKHAEKVAEDKENEGKLLCQSEGASIGCLTCAEEHRQLAEWLKQLQKIDQILIDIPYGGDATVRRIQEVIEDGN